MQRPQVLNMNNKFPISSECLKIKIQLAKRFNLYLSLLSPDLNDAWTTNFNNPLKQCQISQIFITN